MSHPYARCDALPEIWKEIAPCGAPATYRYRGFDDLPDDLWGYRCGEHVTWLDRTYCTVEPLTPAGPQ